MKSISLYEDKKTLLNKIAPESKLLYIVTAILVPALLHSRWAGIGFIGASIILLAVGKVLRKTLPLLGVSGFVLLTVLIIQGIFRAGNTVPLFQVGPVTFYKEGVYFALGILTNVINILLSFCVLILTTKPSDLIENFIRRGFSPRFGYVFLSVFQIIPQMTETMSTITDAQRSRGMETEGNLFVRMKAFIPLISPVIMSSLINTKERALALEVRGFNSKHKKTYLNEERKTGADIYIQIGLLLGILAAFVGRIMIWLR
ncbi:energy-coupling factor transporter transmembrane component T [Anaerocolumna sp. AGMB13025]|uniref:energy-coupling factor transporter transmembrane component T family protein n=1 Tax=Anaerocolumna sp. AGMB13025 TaxID=3039116 RepID=UPI00241F3767|nr:energy-coupling factor transporter transmembrane component T [Anaerocolumna sp. AGMB13025]WFR55537.1 energy-coupling factor transporter transmembrane component T [Anaerocolumna sp. AGMB13025]